MPRLNHLFAVLPLTAILMGGCGPTELEDEQGAGQESPGGVEPQLDTLTQELPSSGSGSWIAPASATSLGTTSGRACFFNRIRGRFDTSPDYVRIFAADGSWYLHGGGDTRAIARCASLPPGGSVSGEYDWVAGRQLPVNMGTASGRVCFLTRVQGDFDSSADWVRVYVSGGSWFLFGSASKASGRAHARCIPVSSYSGEHSWSSSQYYDEHMGTTSGRVCALTYMGGQFDSVNEYIDIYASAGSWYLGGASSLSGVQAKARCF